ncbi:MAG: 2-dehydropantoate 2-reductase [Chloroflexi bacterium]|nr:2-dehydropantoate 2-reductase [Chloroflexota bacterium]
MRIAVYGAGGIGGSMGAQLCRAGQEVALIARGDHLRAIQSHGLRIEWSGGSYTIRPHMVTDDPTQVGVVDLVILGVKAWQVPEAAKALLPMVGPETLILTVQNGVEAPYQVAEVIPAERVIVSIIAGGGNMIGPGVIRTPWSTVTGSGTSSIGQLAPKKAGRTEAVARVQAVLEESDFRVAVPDDIRVAMWNKFSWWVPHTGVAALCRVPLGVYRSIPETRALLLRATEEVVEVAHTQGIVLGDAVKLQDGALDTAPPAGRPTSAALDILNGRPSELDTSLGALVRMGKQLGVPTPVNEFIYAALLPQELKARGQIAGPE